MTTTRTLLVAGVVGAAALLVLVPSPASYEDGIRVKNGSVRIETAALFINGFTQRDGRFRSKRQTKGCYDVEVKNGSCGTNPTELLGAAQVRIQSSDDRWTTTGDQGEGEERRFQLDDDRGWRLDHRVFRFKSDLVYGTENHYLKAIEATAKGVTLNCTATGATQNMWGELTATECP